MELHELISLFSQAGQKLDSLWQFFVTVHLAIYGALFVFHKMKGHQIFITIISYSAFSAINLRAKIEEYLLYKAFLDEIKDVSKDKLVYVNEFFSQYNIDDRFWITYSVHIVSFIFLVILICFSRKQNNQTSWPNF